MDRRIGVLALVLLAAGVILVLSGAPPSSASPAVPAALRPDVIQTDNTTCFACHKGHGLSFTLPSGEVVSATIDEDLWSTSEHGGQHMACVQCHPNITAYPHEQPSAYDLRTYVIDGSKVCGQCHTNEASAVADSVHAAFRQQGNRNAATCSDCHDPHYAMNPPVSRTEVPATCRKCHSAIYDLYEQSVHGEALTTGNPDVPTCTDCHGVHEIQGPDTSPFRLFSPEICAKCHADKELMDKYGISTNVFNSYISDFHGTTVLLFEKIAPDQKTDKPVCIDCHGVHDIISPTDPRSNVFESNLLRTCQRCHPDATADFPTAWLGHYEPEPNKAPLVFYVTLFYKILIPTVIGAMTLFVLIDIYGRLRRRRRHD
jgi:predicted CXXCH cytochrome family protein